MTLCLCGPLLFLLAWQVPANQSAQAPAPPVEIEETVVVTATRSDRRLQDEPLRVEVIDREEIEEKALMTPGSVAMLLGETTGLRVQTTAPSLGAANVRIQGLRGRYAQLLADGLPLYGAGGDSFSMLQVPPLDLGQVEIIKGAASALYGPAALGGVINLVSRRPSEAERESLLNITSQRGGDATFWLAQEPRAGWSWTLLGGFHGQPRRDLDDDGWTDLAGYARAAIRPRLFYQNDRGGSIFVTGGFIAENREGGTLDGARAPDGLPFAESLDTRRGDGGALGRWLIGDKVATVRGSFAHAGQARTFGEIDEQGTRRTWFGEASLSGAISRHTWVVGAAFQQDRYDAATFSRFDYRYSAPALFVQDEMTLGSRASVSASARVDVHSEYGTLASPRVSLLLRPASEWTARLSFGGGSFAPTPFTEETDETGLSRLAPLSRLEAERARTMSADLSWTRGPFEISGTVFGSTVKHAVQLVDLVHIAVVGPQFFPVGLVNAPEPTRTWGTELIARYRRGEFLTMFTHGLTRSTEFDFDRGGRRDVPLTPRHAASFNVMWEGEAWGRVGFESYFTGRQSLDDNPYRETSRSYLLFGGLFERKVGRARVFINVENLADFRQTQDEPLIRRLRLPDGRWTVEAWSPLDGRTWNGGVRVGF
ncbi:MAG TPA: TonB-dependent receptor [Vicinamibacterales bacterium]|nr:TonB-dependent receptor [Vicinamibacterales bacterium]